MPGTRTTIIHSDHIRIDGLSHSYGDRRVLTDVGFAVGPGDRIGLIGGNGVGKSTLLRLIAGVERPDAGAVTRPAHTGILWQEPPFAPDDTVGAVLEAALADVRAAERELAEAGEALASDAADAADRYASALAAAESLDVWTAEARRDALREGLGVAAIDLDRPLGEVSGGQRSRVALAAVLLARPRALLLDEPTNHLDDAAVAFLEARLREWGGPVLFASHDRAFLDAVATGLIDLDVSPQAGREGASATAFGGRFSDYLQHKQDERDRWRRQYESEQDELDRLRATATSTARVVAHGRGPSDNDRFIHAFKGSRNDRAIARRVHNAEVRREALERRQVGKPPRPLAFTGIPAGAHALADGLLVQAKDAGLPGRLAPVHLEIGPSSRLLVTGPNGAGKSTMLAALAGRIDVEGTLRRRRGLRVGLLEQDVRFAEPAASARVLYERALGAERAERMPLSELGLLSGRDESRPVGSLSIGQQRRVALALVIARPPHLFLLDEPTNHLSLALATELEEALAGYPGAVVIASHDRWIRRRWEGAELALAPAP